MEEQNGNHGAGGGGREEKHIQIPLFFSATSIAPSTSALSSYRIASSTLFISRIFLCLTFDSLSRETSKKC